MHHQSILQSKSDGVVEVQAIFMGKQPKSVINLLIVIDKKHRQSKWLLGFLLLTMT